MDEPKRLLDEPSFERDLLMAAKRDPVPTDVRQRVALAAIAAIAVPPAVPAVEASAAAKGAGSILGTAVKWLAIGAVAGGLSSEAGVRIANFSGSEAKAPPAVVVPALEGRAGPAGSAMGIAPEAVVDVEDVEIKERPKSAPTAGSVFIGSTDLELETESLRRIRALSGRDPARALALLDGHDKRFPHGVLGGEARSLRTQIGARLTP